MARSQLIRATDVRTMLALGSTLAELALKPDALRSMLVEQLCRLFRAKFCCFAVAPDFCRQQYRLLQLGGHLSDFERGWLARYATAEHMEDPLLPPFVRQVATERTLTQRHLLERRKWLKSAHFNEYRRVIGLDDCIYSGFVLDSSGCIVGIGLHRGLNERPFSARELGMIDLIMEHLEPMLRRIELAASRPAHEVLPHHLQRVMVLLLRGHDVKRIAKLLDLSVHSVRTYIKQIYRRYHASGRSDLMARFVNEPREGVPDLR